MSIIHISAECYPVAKIGGLADVVGALPKYLNALGTNSAVIMPFYDIAFTRKNNFETLYASVIHLDKDYHYKIKRLADHTLGFDLFLVDIPELLFRNYVYSEDDTNRFLGFQIASLNWVLQLKKENTVVHCHDHHTGLIPFMMSHCYDYKPLKLTPSVLTIHNAQYQGWFSHEKIHLIPKFDLGKIGLLDWDNVINPLAAAIKCAWRVTTVSPSYMDELKEKANGLENLLKHESAKCIGILNGIDIEVWNPLSDRFIKTNYSQKTIISGKKTNKSWLCKEFNLDPKRPLFAFIGRLVGEKGADLFPEIFNKALNTNNISLLLLGSGHETVQNSLLALRPNHKGVYNAFIGYDEKLSHIIYAGADFLLMPSRVEPCGLNQMYSLRYGTIPVVSSVGGLKDTVVDIKNEGFGIRHDQITVEAVLEAIERATELYLDDSQFKKIRKQVMSIDHSWSVSAKAYIDLYNTLT